MSKIHSTLKKNKNRIVSIIDRIPHARKITTPPYIIAKKIYSKLSGRVIGPVENNAVDDRTIPQYYFNENLAERQSEHLARIHNRKILYYEKEAEGNYLPHKNDPRLVAIYLPQFHKIPLNEKSWGKGFTEWTNVASATPGFIGQQQPILPADLGFYDLERPEKIKEQIDLAKKYGIHGFMFYYYWFSGEKILNIPIESFLKNTNWNFNFMISWANENWTKRWDGMDSDVIIGQKYNDDDPLRFIKDVSPILNDKRYITIDGKRPVLAVYRPSTIPNIKEYASIWREYFRKEYDKELYLIVGNNHSDSDPREYGFDALYDFSPGSVIWGGAASSVALIEEEDYELEKLDKNFHGSVVDYRKIALDEKLDAIERYDFPTIQTIIPHWDNHARKKGKDTHALINSNPEIYATWLKRVLIKARSVQKSPLIFINAWNEWAEGAMLEPTLHLGHANLLRTAEVLAQFSENKINKVIFPIMRTPEVESSKIAVIIHLFYPEMWSTLTSKLINIKHNFDIYVTVPEKHKDIILEYNSSKVTIIPVPNWGRDILPFLHVMKKIRHAGYKYILKIHSKKSKHISKIDATYWLKSTLNSLLYSDKSINNILKKIDNNVKIIGPSDFAVRMTFNGDQNLKYNISKYYNKSSSKKIIKNIKDYIFGAGTMFWASVDSFDGILSRHLVADDFELERGQLWNTLSHFIERDIWINIAVNYESKSIMFVDSSGKFINKERTKFIEDIDLPKSIKTLDKSSVVNNNIDSLISVVITNFNYGKYISGAIKSVLSQTYKNYEILIIDDGSTDDISKKVITKFTKKYPGKISAHFLKHQGIVPVRNHALSNFKGSFLVFLDADDLLPEDYLQNMIEEAEYGNFDVVYADLHNFGASHKLQHMPEFNRSQMLNRNIVNMSSLIRSSVIGENRFDPYLNDRKFEDWDFFLGLMFKGAKFSKCSSTYLKYRLHHGQRNSNLNRDDAFWKKFNETQSYIKNKYLDKKI